MKTDQKYLTVKQTAQTFKCFSEGSLRHLLFSNTSFREKIVKKVGKKVLIDTEALMKWIEELPSER